MRITVRSWVLGGCAATVLGSLLLGFLAPRSPAKLRVDFRANAFTASEQGEPSLVFLKGGGLAVAWQSRRQNAGAPAVCVQRFAADGSRLGPETIVHARDGQARLRPQLVAADGGYQLVHEAWRGADRFELVARDADREIGVNTLRDGDQGDVALARCALGLLAAWTSTTAAGRHVFARNLDGGPEQRVDPDGHGGHDPALVAIRGGHVVVWSALDAQQRPAGLRARRLGQDGEPSGPVVTLAGPDSIEASVAPLGAGFVMAWMQRGAEGYDVVARKFDAGLQPQCQARLLATAHGMPLTGARVAASAAGQVAVAFTRGEGETVASCVQLLEADLRPCGDAWEIPGASPAPYFAADGRLAVAWSGRCAGDDHGLGVTMLLERGTAFAVAAPLPEDAAPGDLAAMPHDPPTYAPPGPSGPDLNPLGFADTGWQALTNTGWTPPDPHLAVGPNHVAVMANGALAWFKKDGTREFLQTISGSAGFYGSVGATNFVFDPEVIFDPYSQRFMAFACERTISGGGGLSMFLVAVSDDADPNGTWHKYRLDVTVAGGGGDIDSPQIAVDQNVVWMSADFFQGGQKYLITMLDKTPLLSGAPIGTRRDLLITGSQSFGMPVIYDGAPAMYLIEHFEAATNTTIRLHAITNPLTTPTRVTTTLAVPAYSGPVSAPSLGTTARVTTFDARFWSCVWRNGALWACHHYGSGGRTLSRWYEIRTNGWPATGTPVVRQSGDIDPGPGIFTFFNSISVDPFGNALTCFARSSTGEYFSIGRAWRRAADPLGTMRPSEIIKASTGPYTSTRWGDYSAVAVDPADQATFWYHHEFATGAWATWVASRRVHEWALSCDVTTLSSASGGTATFTLANPDRGGKTYAILGTISGTDQGFLLPNPPGGIRMPLNFDILTGAFIAVLPHPALPGFLGVLDTGGNATAKLHLPPLAGALVGKTLHFAFVQDGIVWDYASNPVGITIVP
jgi:hypothetical protein